MAYLPALALIVAISLVGWVFLRIWLNSNNFSSTDAKNDKEIDTPVSLDHLDQGNNDSLHIKNSGWRPDAIMVLDSKFRVNWSNRTAEEWFGVRHSSGFRENILDRIGPSELTDFLTQRDFQTWLDCPAPVQPDLTIRVRVVSHQQNQYLLQARDISQIRALELVRRDFVSNASHELRTPVSVLYGYLEMMKDEGAQGIGKEWKVPIVQMHEQTARIKQIIEDMLLLSRLEESPTREEHTFVNMFSMLQSVHQNFKVLGAEHNHDIELDADSSYFLLCNADEIESLVTNLVSNAIRYTPDNGSIRISWHADVSQGRLAISDTGIGISEQDIPRITERFYRADPARSRATGGTGLGLAIVNHIVNRHQALMEIDSVVDQGSVFTITFPAQRIRRNENQIGLLLN